MKRLRSILLSGLVALLMVGMVSADVGGATPGGDVTDSDIVYLGQWLTPTDCLPYGSQCLHVNISFDLTWLKNLFHL